jgi:hypothetical protein
LFATPALPELSINAAAVDSDVNGRPAVVAGTPETPGSFAVEASLAVSVLLTFSMRLPKLALRSRAKFGMAEACGVDGREG